MGAADGKLYQGLSSISFEQRTALSLSTFALLHQRASDITCYISFQVVKIF